MLLLLAAAAIGDRFGMAHVDSYAAELADQETLCEDEDNTDPPDLGLTNGRIEIDRSAAWALAEEGPRVEAPKENGSDARVARGPPEAVA